MGSGRRKAAAVLRFVLEPTLFGTAFIHKVARTARVVAFVQSLKKDIIE